MLADGDLFAWCSESGDSGLVAILDFPSRDSTLLTWSDIQDGIPETEVPPPCHATNPLRVCSFWGYAIKNNVRYW